MLGYYLLMHAVIVLFGAGEAMIRLPSLLADALTAALVSALALRLFAERRIALSAGALTAVSLPLVFWGQDARGYSLMAAFGAAAFLALAAILQAPAGQRPSRRAVFAYGLTTLAAIYIGFDAILLTAAQLFLVLACFRSRLRVVLGTLVAVAVLCVPLLVMALNRGSGQLFWVPKLGGPVLGQAALTLSSAGLPPNFHETATSAAAAVLTGVLLIAAVVAAVRCRRPYSSSWQSQPLLLPLAWLAVPAVLSLLAALAGMPIELSRAAILLIPALALTLSWALTHPSLPRGAGLAAIVLVLTLRLLQLVPSYGISPEGWRAASNYVLTAVRSGPACVAFYPEDGRMPFDYYVRRAPSEAANLAPVLPVAPWSQVRPYVERYVSLGDTGQRAGITGHCARLWLIASHQGQRDGPLTSRRDYARYRRVLAELRSAYGAPTLRSFGYAAAVRVYLFGR